MNTVERSYKAKFFPHYVFEAVPASDVQSALRRVFTRWGRPQALRVDNGSPWGNCHALPSPLTLWLSGLGIEVIHNRPYCPQQNGQVERAHGVVKSWIEPATCANLQTLQARLDQAATVQRTLYPSCPHQRPRDQYYPALAHGGRAYAPDTEAEQWHVAQALAHLAGHRWSRKVSQTGQISVYNRNYSVGRPYAGQMVTVHLDPSALTWVIENHSGQVIARLVCSGLDAHALRTLQMTYRKSCRRKSTSGA